MIEQVAKYKKYIILTLILAVLLTLSINIKNIIIPKYKSIPEVKLKEIKKEKSLAIMISEDRNKYEEYNKDTWPGIEYVYKEAKCIDNNGEEVENAISFERETNTVILETEKTIFCTLYFDYKGTGEEDKPYRIQYIEDLVDLQVAVNNGETYEGKHFELARDLDFQKNDSYKDYQTKEYGDINGNETDEELKTELTTGRGWKPIGFESSNSQIQNYFSGILDGKNHRIDHLYIKNDVLEYIGLFGRIQYGEINNLTIGGEITTSVNANIGAFVAKATKLKMNNCHNEANITSDVGRYQVGGLIGLIHSDSEIRNCTNKGNISDGNSTSGLIANLGTGSSESIIDVKIENCENRGTITNSIGSASIGGVVGRTDSIPINLTITNCKNYGLVTTGKSTATDQKVGGIMGVASIGSIVIIEDSDNYGEVRSEYNEANTNFIGNGGGILGRVSGDNKGTVAKIINSNNHAEVNGMRREGGIVGQINGGGTLYIDKSYNEGNVISSSHVIYDNSYGGIVGLINNGKAYVLNTYNKGNVISQNFSASGMVGGFDPTTTNTFTTINSYNIGNITNSRDKASGIIHSYNNNGDGRVTLALNNVYTGGTLSGATGNYGFGNLGTNTQFNGITNVYHLSDYATSNLSVEGVTTKSIDDMKSQAFVDLLNSNKNAISLSSIDSSLSEYTLCNWKLGTSGYPELDC